MSDSRPVSPYQAPSSALPLPNQILELLDGLDMADIPNTSSSHQSGGEDDADAANLEQAMRQVPLRQIVTPAAQMVLQERINESLTYFQSKGLIDRSLRVNDDLVIAPLGPVPVPPESPDTDLVPPELAQRIRALWTL